MFGTRFPFSYGGTRLRATVCLLGLGAMVAAAAAPEFARDIRPILERSCFGCHGPTKQKHGYRLDVRETALKGGDSGRPAILPHNAAGSPLIRYVSGEDPEVVMPPRDSEAQRLTPQEIQTLREWIDAGPTWPDALAGQPVAERPHWALQPLGTNWVALADAGAHALPTGGRRSNPIDGFIHRRLREKGLQPSPEADRATLIRRLFHDLTGLPPTPEEVAAFCADGSPGAYEAWVDRLLSSPRHGERWARHWFDTIHFADSHGYEHDVGRDNAWRFRDYVIESFNRDTPWARFIREQLAADVFYPEEPGLTAALGYLGAGTFDLSTFSTAVATFDYLDRDDLVTQTMAAFVSTTANCARCHAHKFDPITQEDYYALQAVFSGMLKGDISYDPNAAVARERKRLKTLLAAVDRKDPQVLLAAEHSGTVGRWVAAQRQGVRWEAVTPETYVSSEGASLVLMTNGTILATGKSPERDVYAVTLTSSLPKLTAFRLELLTNGTLPMLGPGRAVNGNLHLSEIELRAFLPGQTNSEPLKLARATADFNQVDWSVDRALDGDLKSAWGIHPAVGQPHKAVFELATPLKLERTTRLSLLLKQVHGGSHLIGAFRLALTADDPAGAGVLPNEVEAALAVPASQRNPAQQVVLAAQALRESAREALAKLPPQVTVHGAGSTVKIVGGEVRSLEEPKVVHVLHRGEFDKPRAEVGPGALSALTHLPGRFTLANPKNEGSRRAALADWLAHPDNPLTWRSVVNRVWHYHFGRGICDTPSDFGRMGGAPSHPELLDWLAIWFRDEAKGSLKELHRLIVTSATYRQTSASREEATRVDAENRLLWRQNRQRLDADCFRDFILAISGVLDLKMGGPAIQHFKQSPGQQLTPALDYASYDWSQAAARRRSIYRYVWRGIADPLMESLDFPDLGLLSPARGFSASSLQALVVYNNPFVLQHSLDLAARVTARETEPAAQIRHAVQLVWLREPTAQESVEFGRFVQQQGLPALARLLFNSNEFLFIE